MSTFIALLAPILTTVGFAAVLRATSLLEEQIVDDQTSVVEHG